MTNRNLTDTEEMILVRSNLGDGGWSLHAPGTTDEEIAEGDGLLVCGEAERDSDGEWNRPNAEDFKQARNILAVS
jgi:hypothetical protein